MNKPLVSVCIANYNGEKIVTACIQSVLTQDYPNLEIIVHDDYSTDNSRAVLSDFGEQIEVIHAPKNVGYCVSNNRMMKQAKGRYILLLNNDATLSKGAVSKLVETIEQDQFHILTLEQRDYNSQDVIDYGCYLDTALTPLAVVNADQDILDVDFVHGACMFFAAETALTLGYFPEQLESIGEDLYMCLYAQSCEFQIGCITTEYYNHHSGYSFGGGAAKGKRLNSTIERRYLSERNRLAISLHYFPTIFRLFIILNLIVLMFEALVMTIVQKLSPKVIKMYINAIRDGFKLSLDKQWRMNYAQFFSYIRVPHKLKLAIRYGLPKLTG